MTKVTFIEFDGTAHEVDAENGASLMEAAIGNMVNGIEAECGGACACATCHVFVEPEWIHKVGQPSPMENDMLEVAEERTEYSRLSCQININEDLEGLVVRLPESQF